MTTRLLGLLAVVALAASACSQDQDQDIETTEATASDNARTAAAAPVDTSAYRGEADALAARVARDLRVTDPAVLTRIKNEYYARGRQLQGYTARYAADTSGRYAATKAANDRASQRLRAALTPAQYQAYAGRQGAYYAGPYSALAARAPGLGARVGQGTGIKKLENTADNRKVKGEKVTFEKVKYDNGAKIKRRVDGSMKIRRADGTIIKIDKDGRRRVKKGLSRLWSSGPRWLLKNTFSRAEGLFKRKETYAQAAAAGSGAAARLRYPARHRAAAAVGH